jgi:lysophospholipase L1-like esterase
MAAAPKCNAIAAQSRFDRPLARTAMRLAGGQPIKIVAIGSSSTYGAGASSRAASYPSQLQIELGKHFPGQEFTVLNRGVNGEEAVDMLARFDTDVIAEHPHLVLWQVGTNSVLRGHPFDARATLLHQGIARLKAIRADVVLVDPQFAPKVIARPTADAMVTLLATIAKEEKVDLFHRFDMMHRWYEGEHLPFEAFVSPDGLHMNDWSYSCLAKSLGVAIAEAATRPMETAAAPRIAR